MIRPIMNEQIVINFVYVIDFIIMLLIHGPKTVFLKKSYSLRAEVVFQFINITFIDVFKSVYRNPPTSEESIMIEQA